jgi:hypothetical protein
MGFIQTLGIHKMDLRWEMLSRNTWGDCLIPRRVAAAMVSNLWRGIVMLLVTGAAYALLGACSASYSANDLAGRYDMSVNSGTESIELRSDGTYRHRITSEHGRNDEQSGTWALEKLQAGPTVVLSEFQSLPRLEEGTKETHLFLVRRSLGEVYLLTNIDLNVGFKKE